MQLLCVYVRAFEHAAFAHNVFLLVSGVSGWRTQHSAHQTTETCTVCNVYTFYFNYQLFGLETIRFGIRRFKRNDFITYTHIRRIAQRMCNWLVVVV